VPQMNLHKERNKFNISRCPRNWLDRQFGLIFPRMPQ
jgi:hypothetical protein